MADDGRLRVWVAPDDWTDHDWTAWVRAAGGREMVLRKLYSPPDSWQEVDE